MPASIFRNSRVINSVQRTEPIDTRLQHSCSAGKFAIRKRLDGGYTIAHRHLSVADILPDSFPLFFDFLPALRLDWKGLRMRFGQRFFDEARLKRKWRLDEISPFEVVRVLDPKPVDSILDEAAASLKEYYPEFDGLRIAERWAGCIDATPDAVPVISAVPKLPGFFMATGFSGHGFGLGPRRRQADGRTRDRRGALRRPRTVSLCALFRRHQSQADDGTVTFPVHIFPGNETVDGNRRQALKSAVQRFDFLATPYQADPRSGRMRGRRTVTGDRQAATPPHPPRALRPSSPSPTRGEG